MRSAPADIALQVLNDIRLAGIGIGLQKAHAAHNHSRSAVSALEGAGIEKRLLHRMQPPILFQALDGGDGFSGRRAAGNLTRAARRSAAQDSARATLPFPAAVLA